MKKNKFSLALASVALGVALTLGGCTPKNVTYFQDLDETVVLAQQQQQSIRLEPGNKVSIVVHSKDPQLASLFNLPIITSRAGGASNVTGQGVTARNYNNTDGMSHYTISPDGTIDFPVLGTLHVAGMTRSELVGFIKGELVGRNLIKDPTVVVEFLNTGLSILGEVRQPGRYDLNRDNISIVEALALAGDLSIQGQRTNIKVIREMPDGKMKTYVVDLTKGKETIESPAYYIRQNDIIYVEPSGVQKRSTTVNGNTALSASFWVSVASLLTSISVLIFK